MVTAIYYLLILFGSHNSPDKVDIITLTYR